MPERRSREFAGRYLPPLVQPEYRRDLTGLLTAVEFWGIENGTRSSTRAAASRVIIPMGYSQIIRGQRIGYPAHRPYRRDLASGRSRGAERGVQRVVASSLKR